MSDHNYVRSDKQTIFSHRVANKGPQHRDVAQSKYAARFACQTARNKSYMSYSNLDGIYYNIHYIKERTVTIFKSNFFPDS